MLDAAKRMGVQEPLNSQGLVGLFIELWEQQHDGHLLYKPERSFADDCGMAQRLIGEEGPLALWCVRALFEHPDLKWVKQRTWNFLVDQRLRTRHVRAPAADMMRRTATTTPQQAASNGSKVHIPKGR